MKDNYENIDEVFTEMLKYSVDEAFKYCDEGYDETKNPERLDEVKPFFRELDLVACAKMEAE